jgi:hypothetical protein
MYKFVYSVERRTCRLGMKHFCYEGAAGGGMYDWYAHAYDESKRRDARRDFIHGDVTVIPNSKTSIISTFSRHFLVAYQ